jgi:hypothetical protein
VAGRAGGRGVVESEDGEEPPRLARAAAERDRDPGADEPHRSAAPDQVHRQRGRLGEAPLEPLRAPGPGPVQHDPRVARRVLLQLAHRERPRLGGRPPVDEARVVAGPVRAKVVEVVTPPAPAGGAALLDPGPVGQVRRHRPDGRVDQDVLGEERPPRLDEEPEREPRGEPDPAESLATARGQRRLPGAQSLGSRRQPGEVRGSLHPAAPQHLDGDRVGGQVALPVGDHGPEQGRAAGEDLLGQHRGHVKTPQRLLRQDSRDDHQGEEHGREEVDQVVPRVDGGEPQAHGREQAPPAVARGPDGVTRPPQAPHPPGQAPDHRGTGTSWTTARTTASAPAPPGRSPVWARGRTRWARAGAASALTSSGTT